MMWQSLTHQKILPDNLKEPMSTNTAVLISRQQIMRSCLYLAILEICNWHCPPMFFWLFKIFFSFQTLKGINHWCFSMYDNIIDIYFKKNPVPFLRQVELTYCHCVFNMVLEQLLVLSLYICYIPSFCIYIYFFNS